ncbi:hypothetical protein CDO44_23910 [Pigmentiphaga sp. NML080357]|uniref:non-heme iron oxygenase ferredoxin subunit n=1 Tax=Pigmentiphaga sp. NML080357 TaxID=2008675 RepID=UPI000B40A443|nr:hypothetical protein CDO44_23910 [Pigmentiphaga sp. NML080357]
MQAQGPCSQACEAFLTASSETGVSRIFLCGTDEVLPGRPVSLAPTGLPRILIAQVDGRYYATRDRCTHGNARLSEGAQVGPLVYCPLHGGVFDITTGQPLALPCKAPLELLPLSISNGAVWLESTGAT